MSKTIVYIDAANIVLRAKNVQLDLDMLRLVQYLKDSFRTEHVVYFSGNFRSLQKEFEDLRRHGVEVVYKEIYNEDKKNKANCDVEIAHRLTLDILQKDVEQIVLLSGDGDFAHLFDFAKSQDVAVKVFAVDAKSCSRVIKRRQFTRVSYLVELGSRITKEKPPTGT